MTLDVVRNHFSYTHNPRKHLPGVFHILTIGKEWSVMPRPRLATTRCAYCPALNKKKTNDDTLLMRPLFLDEALDWPPSDLRTQHQVRALREAIAPYLCIAELRRLA